MVPQPRQIAPVQPILEEPGGESGDTRGFFRIDAKTAEEVEALLPQLFPMGAAIRDHRFFCFKYWDVVECRLTDENKQILRDIVRCTNKSEGRCCDSNKSRLEEIFQGCTVKRNFDSVGTFSENQKGARRRPYKFFCIQKIQDIIVGVGVGTKKKYAMQAASKSTLWRLGYTELEIKTN